MATGNAGDYERAGVVPDTAGAWVSFDGYTLSYLTQFQVEFGQAQELEHYTMTTPVRGSGVNAYPLSTLIVGSVRPGRLSVTGIGNWFSNTDTGRQGILRVGAPGVTAWQARAFLVTSSREAQVNDVYRVTAEFQFMDA